MSKVVGILFSLGAVIIGFFAGSLLVELLSDPLSQINKGIAYVIIVLLVCALLVGLALWLGWTGYWVCSDTPATPSGLWRQWQSFLTEPHKRSLLPLLLVTYFLSAPFAFFYIGGWRVFVPIAMVGFGFEVVFTSLNRNLEIFNQLRPLGPLPAQCFGLIYFYPALRFIHAYNQGIREGRPLKDLRSFMWGYYLAIDLSHGLALAYSGAFVCISTWTWSGSMWKTGAVSVWALYLVHHSMTWAQKKLRNWLIAKYAVSESEFAKYYPYRYPNYLL